jgi:hypothetical protein
MVAFEVGQLIATVGVGGAAKLIEFELDKTELDKVKLTDAEL